MIQTPKQAIKTFEVMMAGSALECEEVRRLQHDVVIEEGEEFSGCGSEQETNTDRASRPLARESPTLLTYPEFHGQDHVSSRAFE